MSFTDKSLVLRPPPGELKRNIIGNMLATGLFFRDFQKKSSSKKSDGHSLKTTTKQMKTRKSRTLLWKSWKRRNLERLDSGVVLNKNAPHTAGHWGAALEHTEMLQKRRRKTSRKEMTAREGRLSPGSELAPPRLPSLLLPSSPSSPARKQVLPSIPILEQKTL